jgi:D-alanyl-D-alanine carboxypeptidase
MKRKLTLGVVCAWLIAGCGAADQARTAVPTDTSALQRAADNIHALGVPGVLAEAFVGEKYVTARSGVADLESRAPMPIGAHFHVASNTKVFVAVVTLQLVGEGKLALDDTVDQWLPGLVTGSGNDGRRITVRNLLQHSSGLIDYTGDLPIRSAADWERERLRTYRPEELLAMSMKHEPSWLPAPGERRFAYANINYVLAGMIIEKVTGHSWEQEVRDRIVSPLRLRDTSAPGTSPAMPEPYALSYAKFGLNEPWVDTTHFNSSLVGASGAIISTTTDLNTFFRALIGGKLLPSAQLAEMQQTIDARDLQDALADTRYGLGLIWRPLSCGGGYWSHVGDGAAGETRNGVTSDGRRSVVVYMSTHLIDPQSYVQQERLAAKLVDQALCGK